jgi:hypothetical protein
LGIIKIKLLNNILCALIFLTVSSCTSIAPNSDYVIVEPVKYIPEGADSGSNSSWGWLVTTDPHPDGYRVRLGDMKYHKIIEPLIANNTLTVETAISAASIFAENEVVKRQLCLSTKIPAKAKTLTGSQNPPEIRMYVECVESK